MFVGYMVLGLYEKNKNPTRELLRCLGIRGFESI